jgi:hypothetical protein
MLPTRWGKPWAGLGLWTVAERQKGPEVYNPGAKAPLGDGRPAEVPGCLIVADADGVWHLSSSHGKGPGHLEKDTLVRWRQPIPRAPLVTVQVRKTTLCRGCANPTSESITSKGHLPKEEFTKIIVGR